MVVFVVVPVGGRVLLVVVDEFCEVIVEVVEVLVVDVEVLVEV